MEQRKETTNLSKLVESVHPGYDVTRLVFDIMVQNGPSRTETESLWEQCKENAIKNDKLEYMIKNHEKSKKDAMYMKVYELIEENNLEMCLLVSTLKEMSKRNAFFAAKLGKYFGEILDQYDVFENWEKALELIILERSCYIKKLIGNDEEKIVAIANLFFTLISY